MHAIYDLKEMLCKQLEDYGKKGELTAILRQMGKLSAEERPQLPCWSAWTCWPTR